MMLARYKGSFVVNIDPEEVRKVVPKPFRGVDTFLESVSLDSLDNAVYSLKLDDAKKLDERLQYVCSAFKEATGMFLGYSHHKVESVHDQIKGFFFYINFDDVFAYSPKAEELKSNGVKFDIKTFIKYIE